tara:strand:- start:627 stop:1379 length:753 start_codon:yes stop_codon:yes gene_type:complete
MKKNYLIFIFLILLSCSNDDSNRDSNEVLKPHELFIKQVNLDGLVFRKYTYKNNLISSREYYRNGKLWRQENIKYSNDTIFIENYDSSNKLIQLFKYYNLTENISVRDEYDSKNQMVSYRIYNFSNDNCGYVNYEDYDVNDNLSSKRTFNYIDSNCSVESSRYNFNGELSFKEQRIRDDKNRTNKNETLEFFRGKEIGNTIVYNSWDSEGNIEFMYSYESTFNYNDENYPIYESRKYLDGTVEEMTFEYY